MKMCSVHKKQKVVDGKQRCQLCYDSYIRWTAKHKLAGLCYCGGACVPGFKKCAPCRDRQAARAEKRKRAKLCACGRVPLEGMKGCKLCTEKAASRRAKKRNSGRCQCGRNPPKGTKVCDFCRELGVVARTRIKIAGLCHCGKPPSIGFLTCKSCRDVANARYARRVKSDKNFAATAKLRGSVIYGVIRSKGAKKAQSAETLLGCTIAFARKHIEQQFAPGMTWHNRELWHIDHYIPCGAFNLTDEYQQRLCNNWRNLRPLWEKDNLLKGSKLPTDFRQRMIELEINVL